MGKRPKISVIVPVFNDALYLRKCLESILNQTYTNIEIILVNDESIDNSGEICDEYAEKDARIKVVHQEKQGVSVARNTGLQHAQGEFIGFVDADDYIGVDMYEKLYRACIETGSSIAICKLGREINGEIINNGGIEHYTRELNNEEAIRELFKGVLYRFSLCNKLFSKNCFAGITFPVGRIHEDLSSTYKLFAKAKKSVYLNFAGYIYVKQKESILTKSYYEKRLDAFIGWDEIIEFMNRKYPELSDTVNSCFTYNCVDHSYYILNQVEDKETRTRYLNYIQSSIRNYYKETRKNTILSFHYKFIITLMNYNISLFILAYQFKKMKKGIFN